MTDLKVQEFARLGAEARLRSIEEERSAILEVFPNLRSVAASAGRVRNAVAAEPPVSSAPRRKRMSLARRKAVGERMRTYWATRRAEQQKHAEARNPDPKLPKAPRQPSKGRKRGSDGQ